MTLGNKIGLWFSYAVIITAIAALILTRGGKR